MVKRLHDPVTLKDAAALAGLATVTLRLQIRNKRLKATKVGRDWFIWRADLREYLKSVGK